MKRIRVPEGLLTAVACSLDGSIDVDSCGIYSIVEATLRHISENPKVPTDEKLRDILQGCPESRFVQLRHLCIEWQRRCFQEEEPEIPAEIKDLVIPNQVSSECFMHPETYNQRINEAYRRGLRKRGE